MESLSRKLVDVSLLCDSHAMNFAASPPRTTIPLEPCIRICSADAQRLGMSLEDVARGIMEAVNEFLGEGSFYMLKEERARNGIIVLERRSFRDAS